jgi:hypothetical protein
LKENKIAEATQLLKTVAEDKTTRAEQETASAEQVAASAEKKRKKAAEAWRNLGAIAGLREPNGRWRLMRKPSNSIRTIWRACFRLARF